MSAMKKKKKIAKASNKPNTKNQLTLKDGEYTITHYTFALESDPIYDDNKEVVAPGLDEKETYKEKFLYGKRGVLMQGSGLAKSGEYITIDWHKTSLRKKDYYFTYGVGSTVDAWKTVAADPKVLKKGTKIEIEIYKEMGPFLVTDTGGSIKGHHIDVFVGAITIEEANKIGKKKSKVTISTNEP